MLLQTTNRRFSINWIHNMCRFHADRISIHCAVPAACESIITGHNVKIELCSNKIFHCYCDYFKLSNSMTMIWSWHTMLLTQTEKRRLCLHDHFYANRATMFRTTIFHSNNFVVHVSIHVYVFTCGSIVTHVWPPLITLWEGHGMVMSFNPSPH